MRKINIKIAQHSVWDMRESGLESMPLASGYLKAFVEQDSDLRKQINITIHNFCGDINPVQIIKSMITDPVPDIMCFSVFGWNFNLFKEVISTFSQVNKSAWVILGGNHVSYQAERVFRLSPRVDIVVNGEGEKTFYEIVKAYLFKKSRNQLDNIKGISFKRENGEIITSDSRKLINPLDEIPSPFLNGGFELTNKKGHFKYDVALIETSRGCPFNCGYCYWGGAIGNKIRYFTIERLKEEICQFGKLEVHDICLCDSNFGMDEHDVAFMELLIKTREKYRFPRRLITSWAKNMDQSFETILKMIEKSNFGTSFSVCLQSLSLEVLKTIKRRNLMEKDWQEICRRIHNNGFDVYGELIWGLPNETYESFIRGYDKMASHISRIAVYPHLIMPNTNVFKNRKKYGIVGWRAGKNDFEYVFSHHAMSYHDNIKMHEFLFWARIIAEYPLFRNIWIPVKLFVRMSQSDVLLSLNKWFDKQNNDLARQLCAFKKEVVENLDAYRIDKCLLYLYGEEKIAYLFQKWWKEDIISKVHADMKAFFIELFDYEWMTKPILGSNHLKQRNAVVNNTLDGYAIEEIDHEMYYVQKNIKYDYNIENALQAMKNNKFTGPKKEPNIYTIHHKIGFSDYIFNHEFYEEFCGKLSITSKNALAEQKHHEIANHSNMFNINTETIVVERHKNTI